MVEFKSVISDIKDGHSYQKSISGHHANSLVGKSLGDEVDGIFVGLPGYKLMITGGSDKDGFPMRNDLPGPRRARLLVTKGIGFRPKDDGVRRRKSLRGNQITIEIVQLNFKITKHGSKPIAELLAAREDKE